jgi:hypothetical protein
MRITNQRHWGQLADEIPLHMILPFISMQWYVWSLFASNVKPMNNVKPCKLCKVLWHVNPCDKCESLWLMLSPVTYVNPVNELILVL